MSPRCVTPATVLLAALSLLPPARAVAQGETPQDRSAEQAPKSIAERTADMRALEGLLSLRVDEDAGRLWLVTPPPGDDGVVGTYIYVDSLRTGLGSNPVGLDRGQLGSTRLVTLRSVGDRLLIEQENTAFRALSDDPAEVRAVRESFARSVIWGGQIEHRDPDGSLLVDLTSFVVRDAHDLARTLERREQGSYSFDADRSSLEPNACLAFPDNVELEATITLTAASPGPLARSVAPDASSLTFIQHHSFVRLPDAGYTPREFDPRLSSFGVSFHDYAAPIDEPLERRWIARHRLRKVNPAAPRSRAREPIVYYVDRGAPEPVRRALVEGASWWGEAFEAAGFIDAYRVEVAPPDMHPLDVRHNFIQWVHRSTRGWSYGGSVTDPRTGEIIKGHVSLGSLRVRQDRLIFESLAGVEKTGTGEPDDPVQVALARIRQLSAHEVGHTLGFAHNFAASAQDRASVMDYPAPLVRLTPDDRIDFSDAYDVGVGEWDIHAVRYAYTEVPPGESEARVLGEIVREGLERGYLFISDRDARPAGAAHPLANLWDNGADPVDELERLLDLRRVAIARFGERNIAAGRPLARLQEVFAPLYLLHRYQVEAAVKSVGGVTYAYSVRGDGEGAAARVEPDEQRRALRALLRTLEPRTLAIPPRISDLLLPRPFGEGGNRELFPSDASPVFDPEAAAGAAADHTLALLLHPDRCARLAHQRRRDDQALGLGEMLETLLDSTFAPGDADEDSSSRALRRVVQRIVVERLVGLSQRASASPEARRHADEALRSIQRRLPEASRRQPEGHAAMLETRIDRHFARGFEDAPSMNFDRPAPPGSPIGGGGMRLGPDYGSCAGGGFHDHLIRRSPADGS